ncbi:MAG: hypothetical protein ACI9LX_002598, partial [Paraglaciecola sp.]
CPNSSPVLMDFISITITSLYIIAIPPLSNEAIKG